MVRFLFRHAVRSWETILPINKNLWHVISVLLLGTFAFAEGEVQDLKDFQYWDNGKVKQCSVYDAASGKLKSIAFCRHDGTVEKLERFDPNGHKTEEALFDQNSKLKPGLDGWAAMRWWYDEEGVMRSQISYNEFGKAIERKQYSAGGNLVLRQYKENLDDVAPYEAASMYLMLGGANMKYKDANERLDDAPRE